MKELREVKDLIDKDLAFLRMEGDIMHVDKGLVPNMRVLERQLWSMSV